MTGEDARFIDSLRIAARAAFVPVMRKRTSELLARITEELQPARVLEIGTSIGVSGLTVLLSCEKARLTTIDTDGAAQEIAKRNFAFCGADGRADIIEGDCFEILRYMKGNEYDLIVLDGPKGHYRELSELLLPMLRKGGVLFADDVAFYGKTAGEDTGRKHRAIVRSLREFMELVGNDPSLESEFYDFENGAAVVRKRKESV